MLHYLSTLFGVVFLGAVTIFAFAKGGPAERRGAGLVVASWTVMLAPWLVSGEGAREVAYLASDLLLAVGFLVLAIRYASIWLGLGMLFQASLFGLHLMRLNHEFEMSRLYVMVVNIISACVLLTLAAGTIGACRKRARTRASDQRGLAIPGGPALTAP